jgi:antitoxin HicB
MHISPQAITRKNKVIEYPIVLIPLSDDDGGGWMGRAVDLPGCMSDGETPEEALANTKDAMIGWIAECKRLGRDIPQPGSAAQRAHERVQQMSKMLTQIEAVKTRQDDLNYMLVEMREQLEHLEANQRFEAIITLPANDTDLLAVSRALA